MLVCSFSDVMQMRSPVSVVLQVFREMLGEKNMSGVATIHDALRHVNSSPEEIGLIVHIRDRIDRPAVNAHAYFKFRIALQCLTDFKRAFHRRFWIVRKDEHHSIARW